MSSLYPCKDTLCFCIVSRKSIPGKHMFYFYCLFLAPKDARIGTNKATRNFLVQDQMKPRQMMFTAKFCENFLHVSQPMNPHCALQFSICYISLKVVTQNSVALCATAQLIHLRMPEDNCFPPTLVIGKKDKRLS